HIDGPVRAGCHNKRVSAAPAASHVMFTNVIGQEPRSFCCGMASNESEAVRLGVKMQPDLIRMDVRLGRGPDGIDAAKRILEHRFIPIIFCTGYSCDRSTMERVR